jgi:protoporphyrinogen/coproporphyrinogen III oxidase
VRYTEKVVVIGAGISGLSCAFRLKKLGIPCVILEATERAGGVITTIRRDGCLFETGPQFPRFPLSLWRLVGELNLKNEFVAGNPKAKRYIFRHGRLHPAPFSPMGLIKTQLVGFKSKLRILSEPFGYSQPPKDEESLADLVERKFDTEILDNLVDPFISTIFLGDTRKMGMESAFPALVEWERRRGSLLRGAISARKTRQKQADQNGALSHAAIGLGSRSKASTNRTSLHVSDALPALGSFKSGMAALPEKLADELKTEIHYNVQIDSIGLLSRNTGASESGWQVRLHGGERISAEHLVLAVPAYVAARLLEALSPELARHLKTIEYAPICAVSSAYNRSKVANSLDGFGFMVPLREGLHTISTFWNSSLFCGRAPEGTVLITSFAGREEDAALAAMTDEACAHAVDAENARILGISGQPLDRVFWKDARALPQYNVGHAKRVTAIYDILCTLPSLHLTGNFLKGRSIGECVEVASQVAENLHSQLRRQSI